MANGGTDGLRKNKGVLSQGTTKRELLSNLQSALSEALEMNRERALAAMEGRDYEEVPIKLRWVM